MKRMFITLIIFFMMYPVLTFSQQKVWTLEECINHALQNNIQLKQQELSTEYQSNVLGQSKLDLLPSLNAGVSHNYSFGRALDATTYEFTENTTTRSNDFYASSNVTLFSGLIKHNTIKKNQYLLMASEQDLEGARDNISLGVAMAYLQILLDQELVTATEQQVEITRQQMERTRKLVDAGSLALGNLLDIQSQAAQEELQLVNMGNQLTLANLTLAQMLELPTAEGFEIAVPLIAISPVAVESDASGVFSVAEKIRPEVLSAEYDLKSAGYDLAIAKGSRSPKLSLGASMGTAYSDNRLKPGTTEVYRFNDQFNDNLNYSVGFSLSIPIFNGWAVNSNIKNSKLSIQNSQYALESVKKDLYKTIQQAITDANGALKKYSAGKAAVDAMEEAFRYAEQKFNVGMLTAVEYNQSKTNLLNAQCDLAQSKYEYIFKTKVLDFYKGIPLTLEKLDIVVN